MSTYEVKVNFENGSEIVVTVEAESEEEAYNKAMPASYEII